MCWKLSCGAQLGQMDAESFPARLQTQGSVPAQPPALGVMPWLVELCDLRKVRKLMRVISELGEKSQR